MLVARNAPYSARLLLGPTREPLSMAGGDTAPVLDTLL